ncbi:MAG: LacI family DNA-binding transcriptional regulator [Sphaerochaeta sp.]|nr:LacI family DNA-binding transcriptional regulator [Sphaerochaeta sp.]
MEKKRLTIKDIAREAGVGIGTVSRVLNNSPHISESSKKAVLQVVERHNYQISAEAAGLARKTKRRKLVGILLPDISNHYFFEVFESVYKKFKNLDIDLIILNYTDHTSETVKRILETNLCALMLFAIHLDKEDLQLLKNRNIPYLYVDSYQPDEHCIHVDNHTGGVLAANYLLNKGCSKPCYIHGPTQAQTDKDRYAGFAATIETALSVSPLQYHAIITEKSGYEIAMQIIDAGECDGVFCFCDEIAIGVLKAIRRTGSSLSVIGYDGIRVSEAWNLSTISQDPELVGERAVQSVLPLIDKITDEGPKQIQLVPVLIDRNS